MLDAFKANPMGFVLVLACFVPCLALAIASLISTARTARRAAAVAALLASGNIAWSLFLFVLNRDKVHRVVEAFAADLSKEQTDQILAAGYHEAWIGLGFSLIAMGPLLLLAFLGWRRAKVGVA